ncbi:MAG: hypothetical protein R3F02_04665 [Thiolinea sp.]
MKRLISPPIQNLLWLGGIACLGFSAWNVWQLRQAEEQQFAASGVKVEIPDADELSIPGVTQYRQLVEAPLFWESRMKPKKAPPPPTVAAVKELEVVEAELTPPVARLVGIIDLGDKKYALVRGETDSKALYKGDSWEGWIVEDINKERVLLSAGKNRTEVALISDFETPKANKQMLASQQRQTQQRQDRLQQIRQAQLNQQQHYNRSQQPAAVAAQPGAEGQEQQGNPLNQQQSESGSQQQSEQPAPVLSIKEALEARQRLMAARWGDKNNGR